MKHCQTQTSILLKEEGPRRAPSRSDSRAGRRGRLRDDKGLGTVQAPTSDTVPAERLEAGELVDDRTADRVELFRNRLSKGLLARVVGVVHADLVGTSTGTRLHVLRTRGLDVAGTLVLAKLGGPDVTGSRVLVRLTPRPSAGFTLEVEGRLRVHVGGVVRALVRVDLVGAELGDREPGDVRGQRRVTSRARRTDRGQSNRVGRRRAEAVAESTGRTVTTDGLSTTSKDVLNQKIDRVDQVPRHLVDETSGHVGEAEQVQLVGDEDSVTILVERHRDRGRVTGRDSVRVDKLVERGDSLSEILVQREHNRATRHSLLDRSLVRNHAERRLGTQRELKSAVIRGLDEVRECSGTRKGVSHLSLPCYYMRFIRSNAAMMSLMSEALPTEA